MDLEDAAAKVCELPLLAAVEPGARKEVAQAFLKASDMLRFADGEILIHGGYLSFNTGYVLVDGAAVLEGGKADGIELQSPALLGEMAQFRAADLRSTTVRAKGDAVALQFYWEDLYAQAAASVNGSTQHALRDAIERLVWDRFEFQNIVSLGMFADLPDDLKLRACLPFPSITERSSIKGVDTLFNQTGKCKGTGYLIVSGSIKLFRSDKSEKAVNAPDIVGIFPGKAERTAEWTATAMANGEAEVLKFSWETYTNALVQRLDRDEQNALVASIKNNAKKHFWH